MVIFDPMSVAEATSVLMIGIAIVCVLERGLGERKHKARDHPEMKALPHYPRFYTCAEGGAFTRPSSEPGEQSSSQPYLSLGRPLASRYE